ncbi:HAD family hydrolase [Odoribacter sp. OttesenSCG-928-J03]|nr:HAD family hydrolase [Odoribacter sp. OttesenSCG-928-J03]MDL2330915.1 HAD family hydrolase [Odoribacter sp. OttesenSCG-928-A06]
MDKVKAIITDLDGTILPSRGEVSKATVHCLEQLGQQGIVRVIATGRTLFAAFRALPPDFPIDYLIFSSGAGIMQWKDKKIIDSNHLSLEETKEIADYLWNYNINFTIQREIPDNHHFYYTDMYPVHKDYAKRLEVFQEFGSQIDNSSEIASRSTQFLMILDPQHLNLIEKIRLDLSGYSVIRASSPYDYKAIWIEIYPKNVNKGSSVRRLTEELGIRLDECAGIGNDYNDIDFLNICGQSFVVANAPDKLKAGYKTVASDILEGFTEFVSKVIGE